MASSISVWYYPLKKVYDGILEYFLLEKATEIFIEILNEVLSTIKVSTV